LKKFTGCKCAASFFIFFAMHLHSYFHSAQTILSLYDGALPFSVWLQQYFREHKKFGSKDRRHIAHLCYCYFRIGNLGKGRTIPERLAIGLFLCSHQPNPLLEALNSDLNKMATNDGHDKLKKLEVQASVSDLFPWNSELSAAIDVASFNHSMLVQPDVYLRLRPEKEEVVTKALQVAGISYRQVSDGCVAISNSAKADAVVHLDRDAVVQDLNSQKVLDLLQDQYGLLKKFTAWDCCAASGGKSLLLLDGFPGVQLTVSDVRESILHNLKKRFERAGIRNYQFFTADASNEGPKKGGLFDLIICDAPCSGSGTWSRTPEQLHFFKTEKIDAYAALQKSLLSNVRRYLKPGGLLLYSTCSVFAKENEAVVKEASELPSLQFLKSAYFKGYHKRADTLFAALFRAL
jgi:16S rRNA (cytosine967-C5)-methyltransferase